MRTEAVGRGYFAAFYHGRCAVGASRKAARTALVLKLSQEGV